MSMSTLMSVTVMTQLLVVTALAQTKHNTPLLGTVVQDVTAC
jgi:hypothetical protein